MIADDLLFGIEDALNIAFEAAMDPIVASVRQRDGGQLATVYGSVQTTVGGVTEHLITTGEGEQIHDRWRATVTLQVVTNRLENPADHATTLAKLRGLFARPWRNVPSILHHEILTCTETGSSVLFDPDTDQDVTQISADIIVGIKPHSLL